MVGADGYRRRMTSNRSRLAVREGTAPAVAQEGVPASLEPALRSWIWETVSLDPDQAERVMIRLDLELPERYWYYYQLALKEAETEQARLDAEWEVKRAAARRAAQARRAAGEVPPVPVYPSREIAPDPPSPYVQYLSGDTETAVLWDVVDDLLHTLCITPLPPDAPWKVTFSNRGALKRTKKVVDSLTLLLEDSRSVYEIRADRRGLQRRVDAVLAEAIDRAGQGADTTGYPQARILLEKASRMLFDRRPDPSSAYVEVIRAVEEIACPMFIPNDQEPTLGRVRGRLKAEAAKYEYALTSKQGMPGGIESVIAMIGSIWEGHSDRHGGGPLKVPVSYDAAMTALTIGSALISLFANGAVRRC